MDKISLLNQTDVKIPKRMLKKLVKQVLKAESKSKVELNVIFVDNQYITNLNKDYRHKDGPTDVITFAFNDTPSIMKYKYELLGEIYISVEQAIKQAIDYNHSLTRELGFLVVHGMYHLLGFDHQDESATEIMRKKEEVILNGNKHTQRK